MPSDHVESTEPIERVQPIVQIEPISVKPLLMLFSRSIFALIFMIDF